MNFIEKLFGTHSERELKLIYPIVEKIEALRPKMIEMTDEQLRTIPVFLKSVYPMGKLWTIFFRRHLRLSGRQQEEP